MWVFIYIYCHMCALMHAEARGVPWVSFVLGVSHFFFFWDRVLYCPGVCWLGHWATLAVQWAPETACLHVWIWDYKHTPLYLDFYVGAGIWTQVLRPPWPAYSTSASQLTSGWTLTGGGLLLMPDTGNLRWEGWRRVSLLRKPWRPRRQLGTQRTRARNNGRLALCSRLYVHLCSRSERQACAG